MQARIPAALSAIHNFIWKTDPSEGELPADNVLVFGDGRGTGDEADNGNCEQDARRDRIATEMWTDYVRVLEERDLLEETDEEDELDYSNNDWDDDEGNSE